MRAIYVLVKLVAHNDAKLPSSLFAHNVTISNRDYADTSGSFADVFKGLHDGKLVAVKRLRYTLADKTQATLPQGILILPTTLSLGSCFPVLLLADLQGALVWKQMSHPHVVGFIGVSNDAFPYLSYPCLISPWMEKGNLTKYLKLVGPINEVRERLVRF